MRWFRRHDGWCWNRGSHWCRRNSADRGTSAFGSSSNVTPTGGSPAGVGGGNVTCGNAAAIRLGPIVYTGQDQLSNADKSCRLAAQRHLARFLQRFAVTQDGEASKQVDLLEKVFVDLAKVESLPTLLNCSVVAGQLGSETGWALQGDLSGKDVFHSKMAEHLAAAQTFALRQPEKMRGPRRRRRTRGMRVLAAR
jgi:hypothetical protein